VEGHGWSFGGKRDGSEGRMVTGCCGVMSLSEVLRGPWISGEGVVKDSTGYKCGKKFEGVSGRGTKRP